MAMTEEEKKELEKLKKEDLIDMVGGLREDVAKEKDKFAKERKDIIEKFLNGSSDAPAPEEDADDLSKNAAFQKLKKKIF